jgi:hypothetical protein
MNRKSLVKLSLLAAAAGLGGCSGGPESIATSEGEIISLPHLPALPTSGNATIAFFGVDTKGNVDRNDIELSLATQGSGRLGTTRTLGRTVVDHFDAYGTKSDADDEVAPLSPWFAALAPAGTPALVGARWTVHLPKTLLEELVKEAHAGVSAARQQYVVKITGIAAMSSPAGWSVVRGEISEKAWFARDNLTGIQDVSPDADTLAQAGFDIAVDQNVAYPIRVSYLRPLGGDEFPATATVATAQATPHYESTYCLRPGSGIVPDALLKSVPLMKAPAPTGFSRCTSL